MAFVLEQGFQLERLHPRTFRGGGGRWLFQVRAYEPTRLVGSEYAPRRNKASQTSPTLLRYTTGAEVRCLPDLTPSRRRRISTPQRDQPPRRNSAGAAGVGSKRCALRLTSSSAHLALFSSPPPLLPIPATPPAGPHCDRCPRRASNALPSNSTRVMYLPSFVTCGPHTSICTL